MSGKEHDDGLDASFIISQDKSRNRPLHPYTPEKEEEASALSEPVSYTHLDQGDSDKNYFGELPAGMFHLPVMFTECFTPVSYTHLDVYKRQSLL